MRPKHTRRDSNHAEIVRELHRAGCVVIDVSDLAANATDDHPLDLFVLNPEGTRWVQVEIKTDRTAPFTVSERVYLKRLNCWPPEEPHWCPVIVAYSAQDVIRALAFDDPWRHIVPGDVPGGFEAARGKIWTGDNLPDKVWVGDDGPEM